MRLHGQDVSGVLLRQLGHSELIVLLQHIDGLIAPGQEAGKGKISSLCIGYARRRQEERIVLLGWPAG